MTCPECVPCTHCGGNAGCLSESCSVWLSEAGDPYCDACWWEVDTA